MSKQFAPDECDQSEIGRAFRVYKTDKGGVYKLAPHIETGQWAIWSFYNEPNDWEAWHPMVDAAIAAGQSMEEAASTIPVPKLPKAKKVAFKLDDDVSVEWAKEEGNFEYRCYNHESGYYI